MSKNSMVTEMEKLQDLWQDFLFRVKAYLLNCLFCVRYSEAHNKGLTSIFLTCRRNVRCEIYIDKPIILYLLHLYFKNTNTF